MGGIIDDGNGESRPGAGSVVNINQTFWLFFTENLQKGLGDPSFLLQKRLPKTSVEIAPARQLAQAEEGRLQGGDHRTDEDNQVDSRRTTLKKPAVQGDNPRGFVAVQQGADGTGAAVVQHGDPH